MLGQYHFAKLAYFDFFSSFQKFIVQGQILSTARDAVRYVLVLCKGLIKGRTIKGKCLCKGLITKGFVAVAAAAAEDVSVPLAFRARGGRSLLALELELELELEIACVMMLC
jgi:hypothetical protein